MSTPHARKRAPAVAGTFYPADPNELRSIIEKCFLDDRLGPGKPLSYTSSSEERQRIYGIVSPHAGYAYSGTVAANGFLEAAGLDFENVVLVGPNHYGIGSGVATVKEGIWETPLGNVEINSTLTSEISKKSGIADFDDLAHSRDHCLEVQLPFLQFIKPEKSFKIVPIILLMQDRETALDVGTAIAKTVTDTQDTAHSSKNTSSSADAKASEFLLIASSDFTHYEPSSEAQRKDGELIKPILELDVTRFYTILERLDVSACGYGAIASIMVAVRELGATRGILLKYGTSGDVTGDNSSVVGYASIAFV